MIKWRKFLVGPGASSKGRAGFVGLQKQALTVVGNVGAGVDDLQSVTLEANTLYKNGQCLRIMAVGRCAANANAKTVILSFGGTTILTTGAVAANDKRWVIEALVWRTAVDTQVAMAWGTFNDVEIAVTRTALTKDDGATQIIKCTGEATATDDIQQDLLSVEVLTV